MSDLTHGRFVWRDLMTNDRGRSLNFYTRLFGWKTSGMPMPGMGEYTMLKPNDDNIGGVVSLDPKHGLPDHWVVYIGVPDVDEACRKVTAAGGEVCVPPTDIPDIGRFAVCTDPNGALFSPFSGSGDRKDPFTHGVAPPTGEIGWTELMTPDAAAAIAFYCAVFGWTEAPPVPMPDGSSYVMLKAGERPVGGVVPLEGDGERGYWMDYVVVEDLDATAVLTVELGGKVTLEPIEIGEGRCAVFTDPGGAAVGAWSA